MGIEKMGIRWGKRKPKSRRYSEIDSLKDEIAVLQSKIANLERMLNNYSYSGDRTDLHCSKRWTTWKE